MKYCNLITTSKCSVKETELPKSVKAEKLSGHYYVLKICMDIYRQSGKNEYIRIPSEAKSSSTQIKP